jgi:alpha-glucosidase
MRKSPIRQFGNVLLALCVLGSARPAAADWRSIGSFDAPRRDGPTLRFRDGRTSVDVSVVSNEIVRVRFAPARELGRDHSYAVVRSPAEARSAKAGADARFDIAAARTQITTPALRVTIQHRPWRIAFADAAGRSLDEDDADRRIAWTGSAVRVWKRLRDDEHVYGLGEKTGRLDKRGRKLGGYSYAMWNSDTFAYGPDTDPIYVSVPFLLVVRQGASHGIFFDNTFRSSFDIGHESERLLSFGAEGGELDYYFVAGPHPRDVVARYTALTGRMPLPPRWALGYHQCRYSYYPDSRVRFIAQNFRERRIPADVIWLDIHYLDRYRPFTWDPERFPDPAALVRDLGRQGLRVVTIIDPHPAKLPGSIVFDTGLAGNHFVKNPDGSVYEAPVWPSQAERDPLPSVFPDFSRPATREWWGGLYKPLVDVGVAGIWNDMNEPAVFVEPAGTMPLDVRHDNEGQPTDHREIHNVYGMLMSRSTHEGLRRLRPNARPFVLTRASFAGGQRYSAMWPGDNVSDWEHLRASIPMLLGMGLSGLPFVGSDIGGFAEAPSAELYTRWLQAGVLYPFMRTHTAFGTPDQEPWSYGTSHEALNRRAIELRYELLPQIYDVMREATETGLPAFRPLVLEYPEDERTYGIDDQYLFGSDLLAAPVMREGLHEIWPYLPAGRWFDYWSGAPVEGGRRIRQAVTLATIPLFVRAGAFLFTQPVVQHTGEMRGQPLIVTLYSSDAASDRTFYEDDGESMEYERGTFMSRRFAQRPGASSFPEIEIGAPNGRYRPASRDLIVRVRADSAPAAVQIGGGATAALPRFTPDELERQREGWTFDRGFVIIKQPDRFEARTIRLQPQITADRREPQVNRR